MWPTGVTTDAVDNQLKVNSAVVTVTYGWTSTNPAYYLIIISKYNIKDVVSTGWEIDKLGITSCDSPIK